MTSLVPLLNAHRDFLMSWVYRHARGILKYDDADDLVQWITQRAIESEGHYEHRGEEEFRGWLLTLARRVVADRHDHWSAAKRGRARLLRLTFSDQSDDPTAATPPPQTQPGPGTHAERREALGLALTVLDALSERDQALVRAASEGLSIVEIAQQLDLSYDAAQRAQHRAIDRFKKAFQLAAGAGAKRDPSTE